MDDTLKRAASRVAGGQSEAFRSIVEQTSPRLFRLCARMMGSEAEAEDVLQEAYLRAYHALTRGEFKGQSQVYSWLYRIAANGCLDAMRRRRARPTPAPEVPQRSFDGRDVAEARLALRQLADWLTELSPEQRSVVVLRLVEGHTSGEVASILKVSEKAVEQRLIRARAALNKRAMDHG